MTQFVSLEFTSAIRGITGDVILSTPIHFFLEEECPISVQSYLNQPANTFSSNITTGCIVDWKILFIL
jgi:hypothetical protein